MVVARVALQPGSERDSSGEEEDAVQGVDDDHDEWVDGPVDIERGRDQVEQREHREYRCVDGVVYGRWVAGEGLSDHITDEGHDEQGEYELRWVSTILYFGMLHSFTASSCRYRIAMALTSQTLRPSCTPLRPIFVDLD